MTNPSSLKQGLTKIRRAWLARRFDRALAEAERLLQEWPDNPHLLVLRADLIQLQDTDEGPTLDDARAAYRRAIDLDEESPEPLVALGHFLYAVDNETKKATQYFAKAISLCRNWLQEALLAQAEALTELERHEEALDCLAEARWLQRQNGKEGNGASGKEILERFQALRHAE